ncbi:MAG: hypothetical protein ABL903_17490 [Methylococcales bacterium]
MRVLNSIEIETVNGGWVDDGGGYPTVIPTVTNYPGGSDFQGGSMFEGEGHCFAGMGGIVIPPPRPKLPSIDPLIHRLIM